MRTWSVSVARCLAVSERQERRRKSEDGVAGYGPVVLDECWAGVDCAIYVRYRHADLLRGARFAELDVDLLDGHRLRYDRREKRGSAMSYAFTLHLVLAEGVSSEYLEWTDSSGCRWSGDTPPRGWRQAVEELARLETVLPGE